MTRCVRCGEKPSTPGEADLIETHEMCRRCRMSILEASAAVNAAQDEVVRAKYSLLLAAEFAQYAIEDYADRPAIALLDALTVYQAAEAARRTASDALAAAVKQELDR